ncbi:membrane protein insertion efficiency factor YidD [Amphibiibacter pelophylacis]|uniref:Membrane protein insertion efficiency factor YidD n=1 Tax=Amphibiibacter pelophylacis TaxID=1799477 RepID=A0ACC6P1D9_9BURK
MLRRALSALLLGLIRGYQWGISPMLAPRCRYLPTCSAYGLEAIRQHGPYLGSCLAVRRLCRCHPWSPGGWDPVPERASCLGFFRF